VETLRGIALGGGFRELPAEQGSRFLDRVIRKKREGVDDESGLNGGLSVWSHATVGGGKVANPIPCVEF